MEDLITAGNSKTKTKFYLDNKKNTKPGHRAKYMDVCNRMEASIIFKARTRMLKVKCNYKKMFPDTKCRACKAEEETQEHILETCTGINRRETGKITTMDIFEEDPEKLKETTKMIKNVLDQLECSSPPGVERPGGPGQARPLN